MCVLTAATLAVGMLAGCGGGGSDSSSGGSKDSSGTTSTDDVQAEAEQQHLKVLLQK